jgi:hypothetical protein
LPARASMRLSRRLRATRRWWRGWKAPARFWSARSTWTNMPSASRPRTAITGRPAIRTICHASPAAPPAVRRRPSPPDLVPMSAGLRYQWLDPRPAAIVRRVRSQTDLWPVEPGGHTAVRGEPRSCRTVGTLGRRRRRRLRRAAGPRSSRSGLRRPADRAGLLRTRSRHARFEGRACNRILRQRRSCGSLRRNGTGRPRSASCDALICPSPRWRARRP